MKITHLTSATELITVNGIKILTDPWLDDGIYYGSWYSYPPSKVDTELLKDIDYIYISHIHPDHFCEKTMHRLDKSTPILIHNFSEKFLKMKIELLGFNNIIELPHNERFLLKNDVYINILAADNCNPEICGKAFGCFALSNGPKKTNQIDSLCVIDNGKFVLVNTNDCPYPIAREALLKVKEDYDKIDFLLVGYTGASLYPYAMSDYSDKKMKEAQKATKIKAMMFGAQTINEIQPRFYMPFAGTYLLGGSNWELNKYSPMPELQEATEFIGEQFGIHEAGIKSILLNYGETFDLASETQSKAYTPVNKDERWDYIENVLSKQKYTFENNPIPTLEEMNALIPKAVERFNFKTENLGFNSKTSVLIALPESKLLKIDCSEFPTKHEIIENTPANLIEPYIYFEIDPRLLFQMLKGPRYAHWNNMEIGALLKMKRRPDVYEMGLHLALCYLHV